MREGSRLVVRLVVRAAFLTVVLVAAAQFVDEALPLAATGAVVLLVLLGVELGRRTSPDVAPAHPTAGALPAVRLVDLGTLRLEHSLHSAEHFRRVLVPRLALLADELLGPRRDRAEELLGTAAWQLLHPPPGPAVLADPAAALAHVLDRLEQL